METISLEIHITIPVLQVPDAIKQQRNEISMQTSIPIYYSSKHACYITVFSKATPFHFPPPSLLIVWLRYNMLTLILF